MSQTSARPSGKSVKKRPSRPVSGGWPSSGRVRLSCGTMKPSSFGRSRLPEKAADASST